MDLPPRQPHPWPPKERPLRHALLLAATFYTLTLAGAWNSPAVALAGDEPSLAALFDPLLLVHGLSYSLCVLAILGCHEMGHYLACRYYGVNASPPYFLPGIPILIGTFGAFIRIREPIPTRKALFDIGVAGPLAGFAVLIPVLAIGAMGAIPHPPDETSGHVGEPLLLSWALAALGPERSEGYDYLLTGPLMAAWVGCLATALNLFPVGQLDGGHVCYAISRNAHRTASLVLILAFVVLGLMVFPGWLMTAAILLFLGPRHPPLLDETEPLGTGRIAVAVAALAVFVLCFIPLPVSA